MPIAQIKRCHLTPPSRIYHHFPDDPCFDLKSKFDLFCFCLKTIQAIWSISYQDGTTVALTALHCALILLYALKIAVQCSGVKCTALQWIAMPCIAVQCSAVVQCSVVQCSGVQWIAMPCIPVQCSAVQCSAVQCSAVQCSAVQCSAVQYSAVQCSAVQCSAVQCMQCSAVRQCAVQCSIYWAVVLQFRRTDSQPTSGLSAELAVNPGTVSTIVDTVVLCCTTVHGIIIMYPDNCTLQSCNVPCTTVHCSIVLYPVQLYTAVLYCTIVHCSLVLCTPYTLYNCTV